LKAELLAGKIQGTDFPADLKEAIEASVVKVILKGTTHGYKWQLTA